MASIRQTVPPNSVGQPSANFNNVAFDSAIWKKGYDVIIEKAVRCPCKSNNGHLVNCQNCKGSGWLFINPFKTRALMSSINQTTEYKDWSLERLGTVNLTVMDIDRVSYFDRITFFNDYSIFAEVLELKYDTENDVLFAFLNYKATEIQDAFLFDAYNAKLIKLDVSEAFLKVENNYVVVVDYDTSTITNFNNKLSVRYKHQIQYNVIDLPHDIRKSSKTDENGREVKINLPTNAVARRVHNIEAFSMPDYDGTGIIDNSY